MTAARRHPQVVNVEEVAPRVEKTGDFAFRARRLGTQAGGRALGCSLYELEPGKTAFPFHFHSALEEGIYILEGTATLRIGKETVELGPGDYIAFPPGPDHAHALTSGTAGPLRYLCMSAPATPITMEVCGYPDSKKFAFYSGVDPTKGVAGGTWVMKIVSEDQPSLGYYEGEPLAKK